MTPLLPQIFYHFCNIKAKNINIFSNLQTLMLYDIFTCEKGGYINENIF